MGPLLPGVAETSESTQRLVDEEVRRIVESAHAEVGALLREHRANLDSLVAGLLEHETLDEADAYAAAGLPRNRLAEPEPQVALDALHTDSAARAPAALISDRAGGQSPRRVRRASASWHSTTRRLTGSSSGRSWTRSQVRSAISRADSGGGALPQAIDERDLEALDLVAGIARRHPRQRLGDRLLPHRGGDQQSVPQRDLIHRRHPCASLTDRHSRHSASAGRDCLTVSAGANRSPLVVRARQQLVRLEREQRPRHGARGRPRPRPRSPASRPSGARARVASRR